MRYRTRGSAEKLHSFSAAPSDLLYPRRWLRRRATAAAPAPRVYAVDADDLDEILTEIVRARSSVVQRLEEALASIDRATDKLHDVYENAR